MVVGLADNWFREHNAAAIIAKVAEISLDTISTWDTRELERVGWLNNPIIDILYSMTSAGVWISRVDTNGRVTEAYSSQINSYTQDVIAACAPNIGRILDVEDISAISAMNGIEGLQEHIVQIDETLAAGGTLAATDIVAAAADDLHYMTELFLTLDDATLNDAAVAGAAVIITIQDEDSTVMAKGSLNRRSGVLFIPGGGPAANKNKKVQIVGEVGSAGNLGASRIIGYMKYRTYQP